MSTIRRYMASRVSRSMSAGAVRRTSVLMSVMDSPPSRDRIPWSGSVAVRHHQLLRGEQREQFRPVGSDDDLLLDAGCRVTVVRRAIGLEGENHPFLHLHG